MRLVLRADVAEEKILARGAAIILAFRAINRHKLRSFLTTLGIIIGVAQQGMSFADAGRTYTLLTVGDGLVTQVPALIVSTAAGLLVSKAGVSGAAHVMEYRRAVGTKG